ncbi:DEAD-domain-containing protein [Acrodontium crateriforme]|uniref:ATP-dependent RNA helicase n=1 Tax=Acrodontium crateriforme TaxID=150365 RepID=A0AAQ3R3X8_9PEZI|nr:DEAD-domain-containing protein [Acrodontium crateriforme]
MRRAFTRCSASLRPSSTLATTSQFAKLNTIRWSALRASPLVNSQITRSLHQASQLREQAVAAVAAEKDGSEIYENGKITRFEELETSGILHANIVRNLTKVMGIETMTDVQSATINEALSGNDIIAQAKTGTGKTLAFLLPILQNIINQDATLAKSFGGRRGPRTTADDIRALIISPTRELAEQIAAEAKKVTKGTGIIVQTAVGGTQKSMGLRAIQREGCHILVGTPGRLKDILSDPYSRVEAPDLSALVFDEADRLLDQGFWPEIQEIMHLLPTPAEKDRQTLMFSATVPHEVVDLVRSTLKPGFKFVKTIREDEDPTHARVPQKMVTVTGFENKLPALVELMQKAIEAGNQPGATPFKAIVYHNSTAEVALAKSLLSGMKPANFDDVNPLGRTPIYEIHAKLSQAQRTRAAESFRKCTSGILLSSDVTARGMDFPNVSHVIQMAVPPNREQYIHRIGRTARAGKEGEAWLIVTAEEAREIKYRLKKINIKPDDSLDAAKIDMKKEGQVSVATGAILKAVQKSMANVPSSEKAAVYRALLGVYGWWPRKQSLLDAMNDLAKYGWAMTKPPGIAPKLAQKLGLRYLNGINLAQDDFEDDRKDAFSDRGSVGGRGGFSDRGPRSDFGGQRARYGERSNFNTDRRSEFGERSDQGDRSERPRRSFNNGSFGSRDSGNRGGFGDRGGRSGGRDSGNRGGFGDRDGRSGGRY